MLRRILSSAERERIEKIRRERLAERFRTSRVKAASSSSLPTSNRIALHPERQERNRRHAELARFIRG
jgi:hypothetical protein